MTHSKNSEDSVLLEAITAIWREILNLDLIRPDDNFFDIGGDSISGLRLANRIQKEIGENVLSVIVFDAPTVNDMVRYLQDNYPLAIRQRFKPTMVVIENDALKQAEKTRQVDPEKVRALEKTINEKYSHFGSINVSDKKNPRIVLVLSPPRSGSTLLRVMMAGNPKLFSPPELNLLPFSDFRESRRIAGDRLRALLEDGLIRSLMQIHRWGADEAKGYLDRLEQDGTTVKEIYRIIQKGIGDRMLVDKSPINSLYRDCLSRAEQYFDEPLYIHLSRHPYGMIKSYEESHLDLLFSYEDDCTTREMAEMVWILSHRNLLGFLQDIPVNRQFRITYEDMVTHSESVMRDISRFLEIDFTDRMLTPYDGHSERMTDGILDEGEMIGDRKFLKQKAISSKSAFAWKDHYKDDFLCDESRRLARELGYQI